MRKQTMAWVVFFSLLLPALAFGDDESDIRAVLARFAEGMRIEDAGKIASCLVGNVERNRKNYTRIFQRIQVKEYEITFKSLQKKSILIYAETDVRSNFYNSHTNESAVSDNPVIYVLMQDEGKWKILTTKTSMSRLSESTEKDNVVYIPEDNPIVSWEPMPGSVDYSIYLTSGTPPEKEPVTTYAFGETGIPVCLYDFTRARKMLILESVTIYDFSVFGRDENGEFTGAFQYKITFFKEAAK